MPAITLPDGSIRRFDGPVTGTAVAADIGPGLARAALAMKLDGQLTDLARTIEHDASVMFVTRRDPDALELIRHDTAHVLAEAVQALHPGTQVTIGPSIENGFYYDFARNEPFTGDANTRYNVYGDHVNVALTPFAVKSPHLADNEKPDQWIVDEFLKYNGRAGGPGLAVVVPEGETARRAMAAANRDRYTESTGYDHSGATDAELLDAFTYNVFPNFAPWGGFMPNIVYRWRPWPDQDSCLMEVRIIARDRKDADKSERKAVTMHMLSDEEPWTAATELGTLGSIFDQDMANLPYVQEGLKASKTGEVNLGDYQEIRIRHFHRTLDKYLARFDKA